MNNFLAPVVHQLDMSACSPNKINTKFIRGVHDDYYILQYSKLGICFDDYNSLLYRSVVFSYPQRRVLSFTPMKSIPSTVFMKENPEIDDNIYINEYIEGVMVQLFYDYRVNCWIMATKGGIGGNYCYKPCPGATDKDSSNKSMLTFYDMFLDALRTNKSESLNKLRMLDLFPKDFSYTFIMQHPKNTITKPVTEPHLYLVSVYCIKSEENQVEYVSPIYYEKWAAFKNINGIIEFPTRHVFYDYKTLLAELPCDHIITNTITGQHCRIKSVAYELFKKTLPISAETQYLYLCIRRIGKTQEFVKYYPKYKRQFYNLREQYENMVTEVHQYYRDYYIYGQRSNCSKYFTHIYKIHHNIYIPSLMGIGRVRVYRKTVRDYFDKMEPRELLFILSEERRDTAI